MNLFKQIYNNLFDKSASTDLVEFKEQSKVSFQSSGYLENSLKDELESIIGSKINNLGIYERAFTHRSYIQVLSSEKFNSNERLEFLGDAVLGMVITDYLFANYTTEMEGSLTKLRSMMVNGNTLAICANELNLQKYLRVSHNTERDLQLGNKSILSDVMEALIAAIYLDLGYTAVSNFIIKVLIPIITKKSLLEDSNFKSQLLETVQKVGKKAPTYQVVEEFGPPHDKEFVVSVYVDGEMKGTGKGKTKKLAEQQAASVALKYY